VGAEVTHGAIRLGALGLLLCGCGEVVQPEPDLRVVIRSDQQQERFSIIAVDGRSAGESGTAMVLPGSAAQVRDRFVFDQAATRRFTVDVSADRRTVFVHPELGQLAFTRRLPHPDHPAELVDVRVDALLLTAQVVESRREVIYTVRLSPPPLPRDAAPAAPARRTPQ
jgi:hypothetical protein